MGTRLAHDCADAVKRVGVALHVAGQSMPLAPPALNPGYALANYYITITFLCKIKPQGILYGLCVYSTLPTVVNTDDDCIIICLCGNCAGTAAEHC